LRRTAKRLLLIPVLLLAPARAQQTVAPTPEAVGPPRGQDVDGYNVVNSFETGYRFRTVNGDLGKYRSDVNFGNGVRLLGSLFTVNSREGRGGLFDEIILRTQGLGNDPYQFSSLRVGKNRLYRYDMAWRYYAYFNPARGIAGGLHAMDTGHRVQDHDLTLLPESPFRLLVGYTRNSQDGPALSTVQLFDILGDNFPLFSDVRRLRNEYRLGGEIHWAGLRFTALHGWNNFSETTPHSQPEPQPGVNPNDPTTLTRFSRIEPYRGSAPYWRLNLYGERRFLAVNGRFTYANAERGFFFDEFAQGTNRFGAAASRQVLVSGDGTRPLSAGNLTLSLFPGSKLIATNQTSFHNTRMHGQGLYQEVNNATFGAELLEFQFLGIRAITNTTDVTYQASPWFAVSSGYRFSTRRIRSLQGRRFFDETLAIEAEQDNQLHSGLLGLRFRPAKPLSINLDAEIGRSNTPFFPISERNYHALGARVQYRARSLVLSALARTNYNTNSVSLASHSSRGRNYALDASWIPRNWVALDASYSKIHLDTLSGIAYFASGALITGDRSIYISNIHLANAMAHFNLGPRVGLALGYSRVQDVGDGRDLPGGTRGGATLLPFLAAQTFPLTFETPLARFSLRLHPKVRWNVGYQFYRYGEDFSTVQNYRAHTGYTSLLWSF
jgi:hypothetical protein